MGRIDGWMSSCIWLKHDANATQQKWIAHSPVVYLILIMVFPFKWKGKKEEEKINFIVVLMRTLHFTNERFIRWNSNGQITLRCCV